MTNLTGTERSQYVQSMFTRIARHYDLMNRLMTAGQDLRWRKMVIQLADLPEGGLLLDLGTGTGDLAYEALCQVPSVQTVAADFTLEMMRIGKAKPERSTLQWTAADALNLPFPSEHFDAVVSGFLMRNVADVRRALNEQYRILKPGGKIVILDTTPPPASPLAPLIRFHMHRVIPALGSLIAGQADAYEYLPDSTEHFLEPEQLAARLIAAGFRQVAYRRLMFGTIAIHSAQRPSGYWY
ncbi:MAG: ubiquinone/menaquinone biosynthesis methyltransferase [Chloroflexi bacterium]|jgi:demethylmenaquinone methyltransferase/2-methoxy-6-polyprenyl-1,4-benzoquinol methylase|nr:ubiquinone/menaquinone biosynthesis methyltransferase [Chloroflexota bacterium]